LDNLNCVCTHGDKYTQAPVGNAPGGRMRPRGNTRITQFRWKAAGVDKLGTRIGWKNLVSSCRTAEPKTGDLPSSPEPTCRHAQEPGTEWPKTGDVFCPSAEYLDSTVKIRRARKSPPLVPPSTGGCSPSVGRASCPSLTGETPVPPGRAGEGSLHSPQYMRQRAHRCRLPGRFPGAAPYVSFRQMACLKALSRRGQDSTAGGNAVNPITWCFRSE
jgi:hypothetical protein